MRSLRLSRRIAALAPSSTTAAGKKAKALAAMGVDVVDFSIGEPDFATPDSSGAPACGRSRRAGRNTRTSPGRPPCATPSRPSTCGSRAADVERQNVIVTAGAKQAVFNVCQALFDEGDDVALFSPYWVSFPEMVRLTGARPVFVPTTLGIRMARRRPRRWMPGPRAPCAASSSTLPTTRPGPS